ncbi:hypothetical protein HF325_002688 [Metschnikowia pulcherrima]|uniref:Uncharacterized protein n=1 Tax=Metschnikowia pulcherrima TaxID=27326 RepID=A0A8H7GXB9_9ASCO|nr:hypothetical protein HF325_002688 [Metschnikowia pulcherrima]
MAVERPFFYRGERVLIVKTHARNLNIRECEINTLGSPGFAKEFIRHGFGIVKPASSQLCLLNN